MISRVFNASILDKSSREGIIENEYFEALSSLLISIISIFEKDRAYIVRHIKQYNDNQNQREKTKEEAADIAKTLLGKKSKRAKEQQQEPASEAEKLAEAVQIYQEEREELISEIKLLRALATNGLMTLAETTDDMVESVIETGVDAVIIDYKLSSQQSISYSGVSLAKALNMRLWGFPIFVLTTYQDDLFDRELFDSYLVFDFDRYIRDDQERIEFNSKLIEQIKKYRIEMENCKSELEGLLPRAGESASIDARILELDSQLERSIYGNAAIALPIKKDFTAEKINELILKIDSLIEGE